MTHEWRAPRTLIPISILKSCGMGHHIVGEISHLSEPIVLSLLNRAKYARVLKEQWLTRGYSRRIPRCEAWQGLPELEKNVLGAIKSQLCPHAMSFLNQSVHRRVGLIGNPLTYVFQAKEKKFLKRCFNLRWRLLEIMKERKDVFCTFEIVWRKLLTTTSTEFLAFSYSVVKLVRQIRSLSMMAQSIHHRWTLITYNNVGSFIQPRTFLH